MDIEEKRRIFTLYWGCDYYMSSNSEKAFMPDRILNVHGPILVNSACIDTINTLQTIFTQKLALTPLDKLPEEKIFELCRFLSEETWGDYRYSKWEITKQKESSYWKPTYIKNKNSSSYFEINTINGQVKVYDSNGESIPLRTDYWQWYLKNGISIPIYPYDKTPIELDLAFDKTLLLNKPPLNY